GGLLPTRDFPKDPRRGTGAGKPPKGAGALCRKRRAGAAGPRRRAVRRPRRSDCEGVRAEIRAVGVGLAWRNVMKCPRRDFLHLAAGAAALPALTLVMRAQAWAQAYPTRPITMVVPFPAGGATDVLARLMVERMRGPLGQPIVIENIGGADGSVGVGRTARARPDGYTICLGVDTTFVLNGAYYSLPYDVLNDFEPISALVTGPIVLVARKTLP